MYLMVNKSGGRHKDTDFWMYLMVNKSWGRHKDTVFGVSLSMVYIVESNVAF